MVKTVLPPDVRRSSSRSRLKCTSQYKSWQPDGETSLLLETAIAFPAKLSEPCYKSCREVCCAYRKCKPLFFFKKTTKTFYFIMEEWNPNWDTTYFPYNLYAKFFNTSFKPSQSLTQRLINTWNSLSQEAVAALSTDRLKRGLEKHMQQSTLVAISHKV